MALKQSATTPTVVLGISQENAKVPKSVYMRETYSTMLEEYLDRMGIRHWGRTLKWKMCHFPSEAEEVLESWLAMYWEDLKHLADTDEDEEGTECDEGHDFESFLNDFHSVGAYASLSEIKNALYNNLMRVLEALDEE